MASRVSPPPHPMSVIVYSFFPFTRSFEIPASVVVCPPSSRLMVSSNRRSPIGLDLYATKPALIIALAIGLRLAGAPWWAEGAALILLFAAGVWAASAAETHFGRIDPGPIVIDEVVGMLMTTLFLPLSWTGWLVGFLVFPAPPPAFSPPGPGGGEQPPRPAGELRPPVPAPSGGSGRPGRPVPPSDNQRPGRPGPTSEGQRPGRPGPTGDGPPPGRPGSPGDNQRPGRPGNPADSQPSGRSGRPAEDPRASRPGRPAADQRVGPPARPADDQRSGRRGRPGEDPRAGRPADDPRAGRPGRPADDPRTSRPGPGGGPRSSRPGGPPGDLGPARPGRPGDDPRGSRPGRPADDSVPARLGLPPGDPRSTRAAYQAAGPRRPLTGGATSGDPRFDTGETQQIYPNGRQSRTLGGALLITLASTVLPGSGHLALRRKIGWYIGASFLLGLVLVAIVVIVNGQRCIPVQFAQRAVGRRATHLGSMRPLRGSRLPYPLEECARRRSASQRTNSKH